jgi:exonuclease SbcD
VKVVHTADVHLSSDHSERMDALKEIIELCEDEEADVLVIAGDLFDANADLEDLRTELRSIFSDNAFQTFVIPGNHDSAAFRKEDYFGDDIKVLSEQPFQKEVYENLNIVGVPYTEKEFSELAEDISNSYEENKTNILLLHCTLSGTTGGYGSEGEYLPVKPSQIVQIGFDYIMAGHIHSSATRKRFGETLFTYSGSPVSISSSETGRREVWILDTEDDKMHTETLETRHYLKKEIEVLPNEEDSKLTDLEDQLGDRKLEKASVTVKLSGFTNQNVEDVAENFENILESVNTANHNLNFQKLENVSHAVETGLYQDFKSRLEDSDYKDSGEVEKKFLRGLSRYER